jgi:hypothetical protein
MHFIAKAIVCNKYNSKVILNSYNNSRMHYNDECNAIKNKKTMNFSGHLCIRASGIAIFK